MEKITLKEYTQKLSRLYADYLEFRYKYNIPYELTESYFDFISNFEKHLSECSIECDKQEE